MLLQIEHCSINMWQEP